uniref:Uncharacterized protein n=1 Tax=Anopheles atroparvus TaxID=41427 RepID=A0A182JGF4_ANOAO
MTNERTTFAIHRRDDISRFRSSTISASSHHREWDEKECEERGGKRVTLRSVCARIQGRWCDTRSYTSGRPSPHGMLQDCTPTSTPSRTSGPPASPRQTPWSGWLLVQIVRCSETRLAYGSSNWAAHSSLSMMSVRMNWSRVGS